MKKAILGFLLIMGLSAKSQATFTTFTPTVLSVTNSCLGTNVFPMNVIQVDTGFSVSGEFVIQSLCATPANTVITFTVPSLSGTVNYARGIASVYLGTGVIVPAFISQNPLGQAQIVFYPTKTGSAYIHYSFMFH